MIKIIDRTLSCLDKFTVTKSNVLELIELLKSCDVNDIEISEKMYMLIKDCKTESLILRINHIEDAKKYPEIKRFICNGKGSKKDNICAEIKINDIHDYNLSKLDDAPLRLAGLDHIFQEDVSASFTRLRRQVNKDIEFCPGNHLECGTAAAVEWIKHQCGSIIVTTIGGIGNYAPFEEVLISVRHIYRRHPNTDYVNLPKLRMYITHITGERWNQCSPIVGKGIFTVESGIHIGGILKHPKCYEAFSPESVGLKRNFIYGKFSGKAGLKYKLSELDVEVSDKILAIITLRIKALSEELNSAISDKQLLDVIEEILEEES